MSASARRSRSKTHHGRHYARQPNRRQQRMATPIAALQRRWGPAIAIIAVALIILMLSPPSFPYVLAFVVIAFIALSLYRRLQGRHRAAGQ